MAGNTNVVGGLITSTDKAEASGNNSLNTGTLTQKDLANHAVYSGSSMGVDVGISSTTDSDGNSGLGFSNSMGQGSAGDSRHSTTESGINTANLVINDDDKQQQLTGQSVSQILADVHTATSTDTAEDNSGVLKNTFNQADVEAQLNQQREVTQAFSKTVQEVKGAITNSINKQKDELNDQLASGKISQTEHDQQTATLDNYNLLANSISAGLSVPTDSLAGQMAAAASPTVANQIGQYFKALATDNENGQLNAGQETAHVLAHGILAAAVASAGGNDASTAGIAAAGSEAAAPAVAKWLYGKDNSEDLTAAEKQTLTAILGAASTSVGATTGKVNNAIAAGQAGENAVENNYLSYNEKSKQQELKDNLQECVASGNCSEEGKDNLQQQIEGYDQLDKKRNQIVSDICQQGIREDCNKAVNIASSVMSNYPDYLKKGFHRATEQEINEAGGDDNYNQLSSEFSDTRSQLNQAMANGLDQTGEMTEGLLDGPKNAAFIALGLSGAKHAVGAISGGVGGYTSSGDSAKDKIIGTAIGVLVGGSVGKVGGNAVSNNVANTFIIGAGANYSGQKLNLSVKELIESGFDDFNSHNIKVNWLQVGTSGVGSVFGNLFGNKIAGQTAGPVIGSQIKGYISPSVGGTMAGAIVEGTIIGKTEKYTPTIEEVGKKLEEIINKK